MAFLHLLKIAQRSRVLHPSDALGTVGCGIWINSAIGLPYMGKFSCYDYHKQNGRKV